MSKLGDLLCYALIKQAFSDENGRTRLKSADGTIQSLVECNGSLRHLFHFPKYMDQKDIQMLVSPDYEEFCQFSERLKPLHFTGVFQKTGPSSGVIIHNDEKIPLRVSHKSRFENGFENVEIVHVIADIDKKRTVLFVVSDEMFQVLGIFCREWERLSMIEDYLRLDGATQTAVKRVLCDFQTARSTVMFLAYAASRSAVGCNLAYDEAIEGAVDEFNHEYASMLACNPVTCPDLLHVLDMMGLRDNLLPHRDQRSWTSEYFTRFLVVLAIVSGVSAWNYPGKSIAAILAEKIPSEYIRVVSECLPFLSDRKVYLSIMDEVLSESKVQEYETSNYEDLLFEALSVTEFAEAFVHKALDVLFRDCIAEYQVTDMKNLISGPNGKEIRHYVFSRFRKCFESGEASYNFAAAAILNVEALSRNVDPLAEAVECVTLNFDEEDCLLGLTRISLIVWMQLGNRKQLFNEEVVSPAFIQTLLSHLRKYDKRFYSVSASTAQDLILAGWIQPENLDDKEVYETAVMTLNRRVGRVWAERLLTIMPWNPDREPQNSASELFGFYMARLERELHKEDGTHDPEVSFGVLVNLNFWNNREMDRLAYFRQVERFYRKDADDTQMGRLKILRKWCGGNGGEEDGALSSEMRYYFMDGMK